MFRSSFKRGIASAIYPIKERTLNSLCEGYLTEFSIPARKLEPLNLRSKAEQIQIHSQVANDQIRSCHIPYIVTIVEIFTVFFFFFFR